MADENKAPTPEQQFSAFRGQSVEDGEIKSTQTGVAAEAEAESEHEEGDTAAPPKPKTKSAQERIDQAVKRQRQAERERDEASGRYKSLEERLARIEAGRGDLTNAGQQAESRDPNAPDPAKYQYGELDSRYVADLARYETRKVIEEAKSEQTKQARVAEATALTKRVADFAKSGAAKFEDFEDTVIESAKRNEWKLSQTVADLALESDLGHEILYQLATDPAEAERIASLSPSRQAAWFGSQEARLSAPSSAAAGARQQVTSSVKETQAPPPPVTRIRGGNNAPPVSSSTPDFAAFERLATGKGR